MPCVYCVFCGNRDRLKSYYSFPKKKDIREKWTAFCGINENILNSVTKLCENHFQEEVIIRRSKGSCLKPDAIPSISGKKRKIRQQLSSSFSEEHRNTNTKKILTTTDCNIKSNVAQEGTSVVAILQTPPRSLEVSNNIFPPLKNEDTHCLYDQTFLNNYVKIENNVEEESTSVIAIQTSPRSLEVPNDILSPLKDAHCLYDDRILLNNVTDVKIENNIGEENTSVAMLQTPPRSLEVSNDLSLPLNEKDAYCSYTQTLPKTVHEPRYIGDIKTSHLSSPKKAQRALELAKCTISIQQRKIKSLQQSRNRLLSRITTLKDLLKHLKKKNLLLETVVANLQQQM